MSLAFFAGLLASNLVTILVSMQQHRLLDSGAATLLSAVLLAGMGSLIAWPGFALTGAGRIAHPAPAIRGLAVGLGLGLGLITFLLRDGYWLPVLLLGSLPCGLACRWLAALAPVPLRVPASVVADAGAPLVVAPSAATLAQAPRPVQPEAAPEFSLLPWSAEALAVARRHGLVLLPAALLLALAQLAALRLVAWITTFGGDEITTLLAMMLPRMLQLLAGAAFAVLVVRWLGQTEPGPGHSPEPPMKLQQALAEGSLALLIAVVIGIIATSAVSQLLYETIRVLAPGAESLSRQLLEFSPALLRTQPLLASLIVLAALPLLLYVGNAAALALGEVALRSRRALPTFAGALKRLWPYRYAHVMPAYALGLMPLAVGALIEGLDERGVIGLGLLVQTCAYAWAAAYILLLSRGLQRMEAFRP